MEVDIRYLCTAIGGLSGVPIRIFERGELTFFYSISKLPRDPMYLYRGEIFTVRDQVGYLTTRHFHCYGIVNSGELKIVIGPTRQIAETDRELRELAFRADVPAEETDAFLAGMKGIVRMPFEGVLQILCTVNHVLNGEKLSLTDIAIYDAEQEKMAAAQERKEAERRLSSAPEEGQSVHNSFDQEQLILDMIRKGDSAALGEWKAAAPAIRGGVLAAEQLRQQKNTFIVTAALASRAAVQGGMEVEDAFSTSDSYIQQCEMLTAPEAVTNLQYRMILDYTERVGRLRRGRQPTRLALDVANYVRRHLSEAITAQELARALFLSRPYLSRRFREETGETLTDFILREKTEEAKRLLRYSDKSLTAVSSYLGFSSPSHFSRVFKRYAGCLPREYRGKYA